MRSKVVSFQLWFSVLEFLGLVAGESHSYAATIVSASIPGSADQMSGQSQSRRRRYLLYLSGESNKPLSRAVTQPSACLCSPVCLHVSPLFSQCISLSGCLSSCVFVTPVFVHIPVFPSPLSVLLLDHDTCLYLSISVQPDPAVVFGLFQSVTGWLTDLWADETYLPQSSWDTHWHTHINMNAQAAHSASHWPSALARTANHRLISTTDLWVFETRSLISSTTYAQ